MTKKPKGKPVTMFDTLAKKSTRRSQSDESEPSVAETTADVEAKTESLVDESLQPVKQRRKRAKIGKRSDLNYT